MKHLLAVPNILTGLRFLLVPVLIVLFSIEQTTRVEAVSFMVFIVAALTDLVDGYLARKYQIETVFGKLMDPLADKTLVATALIMLIPLGRVAAWVCLLIICREMIVTGFRGLAATTGRVMAAGRLGKYKSTCQYVGLGFLIFPHDLLAVPYQYQVGSFLIYISLVLAIWSGGVYIYNLRGIFLETVL